MPLRGHFDVYIWEWASTDLLEVFGGAWVPTREEHVESKQCLVDDLLGYDFNFTEIQILVDETPYDYAQ